MSKPKIAPRSWNQDNLSVFTIPEHEHQIKELSRGLEKQEILSYFGVDYDELPEYDQFFFDVTFERGRVDQKHHAVLKLIDSMSGRSALQSSLAYLTRFGNDRWQSPDGTNNTVRGINIAVITEEQ